MTKHVAHRVAAGVAHTVSADVRAGLLASAEALAAWNAITPLARNEWLCWIVTVKTPETRQKHLARMLAELASGKRRPCCWMGCIHRKDKSMSASQKYLIGKRTKVQ